MDLKNERMVFSNPSQSIITVWPYLGRGVTGGLSAKPQRRPLEESSLHVGRKSINTLPHSMRISNLALMALILISLSTIVRELLYPLRFYDRHAWLRSSDSHWHFSVGCCWSHRWSRAAFYQEVGHLWGDWWLPDAAMSFLCPGTLFLNGVWHHLPLSLLPPLDPFCELLGLVADTECPRFCHYPLKHSWRTASRPFAERYWFGLSLKENWKWHWFTTLFLYWDGVVF